MSLFSTIWSSIPFIYAIFTIAFFILIRVYTRAPCNKSTRDGMKGSSTNKNDEKGKVISKVTDKAKETVDEVKGMLENMSDITGCELDVKCDLVDYQTYGEIFGAAFIAGCIVRIGWIT